MTAIAVDLFCGLGGWTDGLIAAGYSVLGFDIERHVYGEHKYPAQLVIQDVLTLHGSQFKNADLIVASPPCQEYSYMAMPWSRAKAKAQAIRADKTGAELERLNRLFNACFRIQREACEAAGRHIPLIVENVRGAQEWVGRARWNSGSFYFWGDVPALMPPFKAVKVSGLNWSGSDKPGYVAQDFNTTAEQRSGRRADLGNGARFTSRDCGIERQRWFNDGPRDANSLASSSSSSPRRKLASALIAKIPFPLSHHIGVTFLPRP